MLQKLKLKLGSVRPPPLLCLMLPSNSQLVLHYEFVNNTV